MQRRAASVSAQTNSDDVAIPAYWRRCWPGIRSPLDAAIRQPASQPPQRRTDRVNASGGAGGVADSRRLGHQRWFSFPLPSTFFAFLAMATLTYLVIVEIAKRRLFREIPT